MAIRFLLYAHLALGGFANDFSAALDRKIARVLPRPGEEAWLAFPWHHDLLEAREEAERLGQPLFIWLYDGNPLGMT